MFMGPGKILAAVFGVSRAGVFQRALILLPAPDAYSPLFQGFLRAQQFLQGCLAVLAHRELLRFSPGGLSRRGSAACAWWCCPCDRRRVAIRRRGFALAGFIAGPGQRSRNPAGEQQENHDHDAQQRAAAQP